ncbi:MAG: hypothetical protein II951_11500 [Bacteroidales bacterium]|nr:hypothetical protein [Bacteroidales bacterium]
MANLSNNHHSEETPLTTLGKTFSLVDLGLSVKWATFNLGASKPEDFGDYYMWGETEPATDRECWWPTYKYAYGSGNMLTKYVTHPDGEAPHYGAGYYYEDDEVSTLDPEDDAAHVALGGKFRIPTYEAWSELHDCCTWVWTQLNGVNGYKVTSNKEGFTDRSIFLPAAGYRGGSDFAERGSEGCYWSDMLDEDAPNVALGYSLDGSYQGFRGDEYFRCFGLSIRPVSK